MAEYNESQINSNETERISAEQQRIENEAKRQTKETEREARESTRQSNESTRISKEAERLAEEVNRVEAEASRVTAENSRIEAENIRAEFYEGFNSDLEGLHAKDEELSAQLAHNDNIITKNVWVNDLKGEYIAHKGYNGLKYDGPVTNCIRPENTIASIELAGGLGFKAVEIDVLACRDNFILSHEQDTKYLDGDLAYYKNLTLDEIKERTIIKSYKGGGAYEELTGVKAGNKVPSLHEALLACKKFNMYAILDVRYVDDKYLTQDEINLLVEIVKSSGMESKILFYGNSSERLTDILKDSIYCGVNLDTSNIDNSLNFFKTKRNYCLSISEETFYLYKDYISAYNIPALVWTIDDYLKADDLFDEGATSILTNRCITNKPISHLKKFEVPLDMFVTNGVGTESVNNGIHTISSSTYFSKLFEMPAGKLKLGDVIVVKAEGRTIISNDAGAYGRIEIGNHKGGYYDIHSTRFFKKNTFETKDIYYVVTNEDESIYINYGLAGAGYSGNGTCELKNISIEVYTNNIYDKCYGYLTCYRNGFNLRGGFATQGIKSVYRNNEDSSILCIEHGNLLSSAKPVVICSMDGYSTQYKYRVIPFNDKNVNKIIQVKFLDNEGNFITDVNTLELGFTILII